MSKSNLKPFTAEMFTPMQTWYTAQDKADFGNGMIRFIESGFSKQFWTKKIYQHLSNCFGHIAHYDIHGFYDVWFSDLANQTDWLRHVTRCDIYGDPAYTRSDVERALRNEIVARGYYENFSSRLRTETELRERAQLSQLKAKYPEVSS